MTVQLKDSIEYKKSNGECEEYDILDVLEGGCIFDPVKYGIDMDSSCFNSACFKGYQAIYSMIDSVLILKDLYVNIDFENPLKLNNVEPIKQRTYMDMMIEEDESEEPAGFFNAKYQDVNIALENYNGKLLIGRVSEKEGEFVYALQDSLEYWEKKYDQLVEVAFDSGHIMDFRKL